MKKTLLLLCASFLCSMTYAQDNFISEYFSQYEEDPAFATVNVTDKTFSLITEIETKDEDEKRVLGAIAKLDGVKVLHKENTEDAETLYSDAMVKIENDGRYEELASAQTQKENFFFMIREEDNVVRELTIVVGDEQQFLLATLYGEIELKNISRLTSVIKNNGKDWFDIFENIDSDELVFNGSQSKKSSAYNKDKQLADDISIKVFPNPVSDYVQLENAGLSGATYELEFFSIIGEPIKKVGQVNLPYKVHLTDLPSGAYFLRLTNTEGAFKNFRIVKP